MSLVAGLILRLMAVALLCLTCAVGWIVVDTKRALRVEAEASADRTMRQLMRRQWLGSANASVYSVPFAAREALGIVTVLGPGICVDMTVDGQPNLRLCNGSDSLGMSAPDWFASVFAAILGPGPEVKRSAVYDGRGRREQVEIGVTADPVAATARAWHQVRVAAGTAAAMAAVISVLMAALIAHILRPAETIVKGIRRLAEGDGGSRLPSFRVAEFRHIAEAFNGMADRLERTAAERKALTLRLFQVQEDERKALARDLHDEFGQCLTAVAALAASIETGAGPERPDLARDAGMIARITAQMMATLKGAFARLRPPEIDELGLEESLRSMVRKWSAIGGSRANFRLEVEGDLASLPPTAALSVYRIAQESITNAARHGSPSRILVRISRPGTRGEGVDVVVEDDGGGTPEQIVSGAGFGVLGIRERIDALGGWLSFSRSKGGVSMHAFVPVPVGGSS